MKKITALICLILLSTVLLCACAPTEKSVRERYEEYGYSVAKMNKGDMGIYGIDTDKIEYAVYALSEDVPVEAAYIVLYKNKQDAAAFAEQVQKNILYTTRKFSILHRGKLVIFGTAPALEIA